MMQTVLKAKAHRNPRNFLEVRRCACVELRSVFVFITRNAYSPQRSMNRARVKTWKERPANMMLFPMEGSSPSWEVTDAIPPPAPRLED